MPIVRRRCVACRHAFELLSSHGGILSALDRPDIDDLSCPKCGHAEAVAIVSAGFERDRNVYPYFDESLGREILSRRHRDEVCRELGVVAVDGALPELVEKRQSRERDQLEADERVWKEYQRELATRPELREAQARYKERVGSLRSVDELQGPLWRQA